MRIFLTGATGFIGTHIIPELLGAGHHVLGLTRSDAGAKTLADAGAEPFRGTLEEPEGLARGAAQADAVIHCAFDHDFSNFVANCEKDKRAITAMGQALAGSDKPFVITSGTGVGLVEPGKAATEDVMNVEHPNPRIGSELAGQDALKLGVKVIVVRLPQVHDTRRQGLISPLAQTARRQGVSAYVGEGRNSWPAGHVRDVARLYKLAVEQGAAGERFNAVGEEGIRARDIAEALGRGLKVPVTSIPADKAEEHFGWLGMFVGMDMPASSAWTRQRLGWTPKERGLIADLDEMDYSQFEG